MSEDGQTITIEGALRDPGRNADCFNRQMCIKGVQLDTLRRFRLMFDGHELGGGIQQMVGVAQTAYRLHANFLGEDVINRAKKKMWEIGRQEAEADSFEGLDEYGKFVDPNEWMIENDGVERLDDRLNALDSLLVAAIKLSSGEEK